MLVLLMGRVRNEACDDPWLEDEISDGGIWMRNAVVMWRKRGEGPRTKIMV